MIILVIFVCLVSQNIVMFRGGMRDGDNYRFPSLHDTMWNMALTGELSHHFPPQHPGMAGESLKNNHYFYPWLLAIVHNITGISIIDLYFRIGPVLVSLLFGVSLYWVSTIFTKKPAFNALMVFLGYFSGNISYLLPLFYRRLFNWQGNTFLSDQPFDQLINPYSVLGFSLMLISIYLVNRITETKRGFNLKYIILFSIISGVAYGFKSFGGIILICAVTVSTLIYFLKDKRLFCLTLLSLLFFFPVFFLITEPQKAGLRFAPGWLLTEMMIKKDGLDLAKFAQIEDFYRQIGNIPGILKIKMIELAVYITGNLGVRIIGLFMLVRILFKTRKFVHLYMFQCVLFSLSIPLLFNLGANAHNIVQFTPYSLVILGIMSGVFLEKTFNFLRVKGKRNSGIFIIVMTILLAIPVNIRNIYAKLEKPDGLISVGEMDALNYIKNNSGTTDIILIDPRQYSEDPMYVSAISERRIYLASQNYARQTNRDPEKRTKEIKLFFDNGMNNPEEYFSLPISYIFIKKPFDSMKIMNATQSGWINKFENSRSIILSK